MGNWNIIDCSDEHIRAKHEEFFKLVDIEEKEKENRQVTTLLTPITGGKGTGNNWLDGLSVGTIFLTRPSTNQPTALLQEFEIVEKVANAVKLLNDINDPITVTWWDSTSFSNTMGLYAVLYDPNKETSNTIVE